MYPILTSKLDSSISPFIGYSGKNMASVTDTGHAVLLESYLSILAEGLRCLLDVLEVLDHVRDALYVEGTLSVLSVLN